MTSADPDLVAYFDYLCLSRERLFEWVQGGGSAVYMQPFSVGLGSISATLLHTARSQWAYSRWLDGAPYLSADNPFTAERFPAFEPLAAAWTDANPYTRRVLAGFDRNRRIEWVPSLVTPPRKILITGAILAGQLLFHEVHHRAQVMTMLRRAGVPAENLDYAVLMSEATPV